MRRALFVAAFVAAFFPPLGQAMAGEAPASIPADDQMVTVEMMLEDAVSRFTRMDRNGDGVIDRYELDAAVRSDFKAGDLNHDGVIDDSDRGLSQQPSASAPLIENPPGATPDGFEAIAKPGTTPLLDEPRAYTPRQDLK